MQHYKNPYLVHFGTFAPDGPGRPGGNEFTPLGPLDKNDIVFLQGDELRKRRKTFELKMRSLEMDYADLQNARFDKQRYIEAKEKYDAKIKELQDAMEEFKNLADYQGAPAMNEEKETEWRETLEDYKI